MNTKICLVTGANSGLGKATAQALACAGERVVLLCRDQERGNQARSEVITKSRNLKVDLMICDLSSMASVRRFARQFRLKYPHLDLLANMAGIQSPGLQITSEGFEVNFATNILGPFLLTNLLINHLAASSAGTIINVSGESHRNGVINFADPQMKSTFSTSRSVSQTALARVIWTYELARRLEGTGVVANTFAPGNVRSGINRHYSLLYRLPVTLAGNLMARSPEEAIRPIQKWLLREDDFVRTDDTGLYLLKGRAERSLPLSYDGAIGRKWWSICEEMTQSTLKPVRKADHLRLSHLQRGQGSNGAIWRLQNL